MSRPSAALLLDPKSFKKQSASGKSTTAVPMSFVPPKLVRGTSAPPTSASPSTQDTTMAQNTHSSQGRSASRTSSTTSSPGAPAGTAFDPRQLLDPRGPRRNPDALPRRPKPTPSSIIKSGDDNYETRSEGESGGKREFEAFKNGSQVGMLESMYGVERRRDVPQKRTKVDKPGQNGSDGAISERLSKSGGSLLGDYMKQDTGNKEPTQPPATTIDLTAENEDDDDVIFVANRDVGSEEVCYGKLEGAKVHAHQVPMPPRTVFQGMTHDWPSMRCELVRQPSQTIRIDVRDPTGRVFGTIDPVVSAALAPLMDMAVVKLRTQARLDVRRKRVDEWPGQPCSDTYRISINLYGPRRTVESTGRFLSQKNIWLGVPNSVEAGIPVVNPHAEKRLALAAATPATRYSIQSETRTAEEINSAVTKMFDQLSSTLDFPMMDPPSSVITNLLPHQKQALWYMTDKEKPRRIGPNEEENNSLWRTEYKSSGQVVYREIISGITAPEEPPQVYGGLLADMMGLGKTLSILSLVCSTLTESDEWEKSTQHDGAALTNPLAKKVKTTLLVSPLTTVGNWVSQIKEHLEEDALKYYVFHGPSRTEDPKELAEYDLVITTYSTVMSDISGKSAKRKASPLAQMNFFRIVLDEAHAIREPNTAQSKAIFSLDAQRRWSVTGTPIQNRLEDLASVTRFLRLFPYDDRGRFTAHIISPFKSENPSAIKTLRVLVDSFTLRRVKDRINLPARHDQTVILTFSEREKALHEFFRNESNVMMNVIAGQTKEKISGKMFHLVLKAMMILRQISAHGKELLDQEDRERFKGFTASDAIDLEEVDDDASGVIDKKAYEMLSLMKESSADVCAKCGNFVLLQQAEDTTADKEAMAAVMLPCYDLLCSECFAPIRRVFDQNAGQPVQLKCLFCKGFIPPTFSAITAAGFEAYQSTQRESKQNRKQIKTFGEYEGPHTKTKALVTHLLDSAEESKKIPDQPPIKSVVFSSWTSHLDLIEIALQDHGINGFTRLDGTMSLRQRNAALETFRTDNNTTVLLATLGAGGVGLNLTSASKVYVMEPQYNPAAVAQAVDRVHRLGQNREVTTVQFIMKDSIEEKIAELAKRKQRLADISLNRGKLDKREMHEERMKEYRSLFK